MTHLPPRVAFTTATTGAGAVSVGAALAQMLTPAQANAVDGRSYLWLIQEGDDWQLVRGVYTASGPSFSRDTTLLSLIDGTPGTSDLDLAGDGVVRLVLDADTIAPPNDGLLYPLPRQFDFDDGVPNTLNPKTHSTVLSLSPFSFGVNNSSGTGASAVIGLAGLYEKGWGALFHTGTTDAGRSSHRYSASSEAGVATATAGTVISAWVMFPTIFTESEDFEYSIGVTGKWAFTNHGAQAIYFVADRTVNSGNWSSVTRASSTSTVKDSGVAPASGVWSHLAIHIVSGSEVRFYVDNVLAATHGSGENIPTLPMTENIASVIWKVAGSTRRDVIIAGVSTWREL